MTTRSGSLKVWAQDDTLYLGDNGACYCGAHLGSSARHTGRDLSGQPVMAITPDEVREADAMGFAIQCETCGSGSVSCPGKHKYA